VQLALQRLAEPSVRHVDALHDLLLAVGDLTLEQIEPRCVPPSQAREWTESLVQARRAVRIRVAEEQRHIAVEDAARFRDALGVALPPGLPAALLEPVGDALGDLVSRYARTHAPFTAEEAAAWFGLGTAPVLATLERLAHRGRVLEGEFLPGGQGREWCDSGVLRQLKQKTLARLRREVEPVEPAALARFLISWHGIEKPRSGGEALLDAIDQLQGAAIPASALLAEVLPARVLDFTPADLDLLCAQGEVVWRGIEPLGQRDGRIALYLSDSFTRLAPAPAPVEQPLARDVVRLLGERGALFYAELLGLTGAFGPDLVAALWDLVWAGVATNDTLLPLRSLLQPDNQRGGRGGRVRRAAPPGSEGRWSLVPAAAAQSPSTVISETERQTALTEQLLTRHGVVTREAVHAEGVIGGFATVYPVLKAMEEAGRARRGYFVAGLGATQFARPGADEALRTRRDPAEVVQVVTLSATDPANPYGAILPWPAAEPRLVRVPGAKVLLRDGALVAYVGRTERTVSTFLPETEPARGQVGRDVATTLAQLVDGARRRALLIASIDGKHPGASALGAFLLDAGFIPGTQGYLRRAEGTPTRR
jgi:ATP-dependent Lhr-like helicase